MSYKLVLNAIQLAMVVLELEMKTVLHVHQTITILKDFV